MSESNGRSEQTLEARAEELRRERGRKRRAATDPSTGGQGSRLNRTGGNHVLPQEEPPAPPRPCIAASQLKARKVSWLSKNRLAYGTVAVLDGDKGDGKSTTCASLAAHITTGQEFPDAEGKTRGAVLWLPGEEAAEISIVPRLEAAGADLDLVRFPGYGGHEEDPQPFLFPTDTQALKREILSAQAKLVVIDPLECFIQDHLSVSGSQDMRRVLGPLSRVASETGAVILLTRNLNKDRTAKASHRGTGSHAIAAVARSHLLVSRDPTKPGRRLLCTLACNLGQPAAAVTFDLELRGEVTRIVWGEAVAITGDQATAMQGDEGERSAFETARRLIHVSLKDGPRLTKDIQREADNAGIGWRTMERALATLGVRRYHTGGNSDRAWWCGPPEEGWPADLA